ncbi:hypothetical protein G9A89_014468 [Geosiphon pyriformis]|nr:hypothetical protein G9A89_014468 [Geosiphon pyriformis]
MAEVAEQTHKKSKWLPLESNPEVMNKYVHKLGVSTKWAFTDVWALESEFLNMIPHPVLAVLLLYPITANNENIRQEQEALLVSAQEAGAGQIVSDNVIFYKQTIPNACGTISLLHSLANNLDKIEIDEGPIKRLIDRTRSSSPEERAKVLEGDEELAQAHRISAEAGQSRPYEDTNLHFTCFVQKDGHLYELDGRKPFPINHGPSSNLLEDSARVIKEFMNQNSGESQFTVIALGPNQQ